WRRRRTSDHRASDRRRACCGTSMAGSAAPCRACCSIAKSRIPDRAGWTAPPAPGQYPAMPKKIAKKALPAPTAGPLMERVDKRRAKLATAKTAATKDGAVVKHDPKYRTARKRLKRAQ